MQLEEYLSTQDTQKFSSLMGAQFTTPRADVLTELNRFIDACSSQFDVQAVYVEMNGFDINYDCWYFDLFAYSTYSDDFDDTEWLCDWQSGPWAETELQGMESGQSAFSWYHEEQIWESRPDLKAVYDASMLLVMAKFCAFIGEVLASGTLCKNIPVLVTAHGFDSVARFEPRRAARGG